MALQVVVAVTASVFYMPDSSDAFADTSVTKSSNYSVPFLRPLIHEHPGFLTSYIQPILLAHPIVPTASLRPLLHANPTVFDIATYLGKVSRYENAPDV